MMEISTTSYDRLLQDLKNCEQWFKSLSIGTLRTRFQSISNYIEILDHAYKNGSMGKLLDTFSKKEIFNSLFEAQAFISIHKSLKKLNQDHLPKVKLKKILEGPLYVDEEEPGVSNDEPRNILFELELASELIRKGFEITDFKDINFKVNGCTASIECKRPQSELALVSNIGEALNSLTKSEYFRKNRNGIVAISTEKLFQTPSEVDKEEEITSFIKEKFDYLSKYKSDIIKTLNGDERILAIFFIFKFNVYVKGQYLPVSVFASTAVGLSSNELKQKIIDRLR